MIDAANLSGADAVKFQTFKAETLVSKGTPKVKYQESTTALKESHFEMIKSLELSYENHFVLKDFVKRKISNFYQLLMMLKVLVFFMRIWMSKCLRQHQLI